MAAGSGRQAARPPSRHEQCRAARAPDGVVGVSADARGLSHDVAAPAGAVPHIVRLHLGRAAAQTLANIAGVELLHIKGDAVEPKVRPESAPGSDVDVLVRPSQLPALHAVLRRRGWRVYSTFRDGSPFGHAQTYLHETWGYLDVHRSFPGIGIAPSAAFDRLWSSRRTLDFAGVLCPVPSLAAQSVIVILNAARARSSIGRDIWNDATADRGDDIEREVDALDARLAFDAAFGRLAQHRGAREYRLWRSVTEGGGRIEEWLGRIEAAATLRARVAVILRAPLVNRVHLEHELGRAPTPLDVVREFFARSMRGVRELLRRKDRRDQPR